MVGLREVRDSLGMEPHVELDQGANVEREGREGFWIKIAATALIVDSTFVLAIAELDQSGNQH
jgi:hypothetical protein